MSVFENFVTHDLEDNTSLSFKFNVGEYSAEEIKSFSENICYYVMNNSHGTHIYYSGGKHEDGKASLPHYHLHFCVQHWHTDKNESRRRGQAGGMPTGLSCKISTLNDTEHLEKHMSYPLKENKILKFTHQGILNRIVNIPENIELYLVKNGVALYQAKLSNDLKKCRASARSGNIQTQLFDIIGTKKFNNYKEYKEWIYPAFYEGLEITEYPDTSLFIKEVGKVAIFLRIVPAYYFDKN